MSCGSARYIGLGRGYVARPAVMLAIAGVIGSGVAACGVAPGGIPLNGNAATAFPDVNLSVRPCAIQAIGLLTAAQLPPHLTTESPVVSYAGTIGPNYDLGNAGPVYPGSIGDANAYFQWTGFTTHPVGSVPDGGPIYASHPTQVFQLAEEVDDWGTVANAKRWMSSQLVNQGDIVPVLGDDTFMFHDDEGEANGSAAYTDADPGDVYTDIEVRDGNTVFALSIDAGPAADPSSLAVSLMRSLVAKERAVCG